MCSVRVTTCVLFPRDFLHCLQQEVYTSSYGFTANTQADHASLNSAGKGKGKLTCCMISPVYFLASLKFIMRQLCCRLPLLVSVLVQVRQGQCHLAVPRPSSASTSRASKGRLSSFYIPSSYRPHPHLQLHLQHLHTTFKAKHP